MSMLDKMADGNAALLGGVALGRQLGEDLAGYIIDSHYARKEAREAEAEQRRIQEWYDSLMAAKDEERAYRLSNAARLSAVEKMLKSRGIDINGKDHEEYIRCMREYISEVRKEYPDRYNEMKRLKKIMPISKEPQIAEEIT